MFRLLVSGSREWDQPEVLEMILMGYWIDYPDLIIVHGDCAKGADRMARNFAEKHEIRQEKFPVSSEEWKTLGKGAGHIRNKRMVDTKPDEAVFFIRGVSKGTLNCLGHARKAGIPYVPYGEKWRIPRS